MRYYVRRPESILDKFMSDVKTPTQLGKNMDVYKLDNRYVVEIDMPGFNKEDISIDFKEDVLSINAKHEVKEEHNDREMIYQSRRFRDVSRQIRFSEVDVERIEAEYTNGTLSVTLPLLEKIEPETVQIALK